jgi:hypothetical protein
MKMNSIVVERITTNSKLFAHTRMQAFRDQIVEQQRAAGVRVIKPPHALGFLDPNLPPHGGSRSMQEEPRPA